MGEPIKITKRAITQSDIALLETYLVTSPNSFSHAYELTPHHTTFSNPVSLQIPEARAVLKVPHYSNGGTDQISAEFITNPNNFTIDSFSTVYVLPVFNVKADGFEIEQIDTPYNPNYYDGGIFAHDGDARYAAWATYNTYALVQAPIAVNALKLLGGSIAGHPGESNATALNVRLSLVQLGGNAYGPRDGAVIVGVRPSTYGYNDVSYNININSNYYRHLGPKGLGLSDAQSNIQLFNTYTKFAFESLGWDFDDMAVALGGVFFTSRIKSPVPGAPTRNFIGLQTKILNAYRAWAGDDNILGVPMASQLSKSHLFAGGYHSDRYDTADFYFGGHEDDTSIIGALFKGGPLNQPIPHPALMTEMLSTNSLFIGKTPSGFGDDEDEYLYKRHYALDTKHFSPNYIITEEAMEFAGYSFYEGGLDSGKSIVDCLFQKPSHHTVGAAPITSTKDKLRIRNYSEDKYLIHFAGDAEERHLMINKNYYVPHSQNDPSVDQALRYFGYIPFGMTSPTVYDFPGSRDSAVFVENGEKQEPEGFEITPGGSRVMHTLGDYVIYVSANAASIHREIGLNDLGGRGVGSNRGLLYNYFMAQSILSVIDVGDDALDLETEASVALKKSLRCHRYVLVLHKDFEF